MTPILTPPPADLPDDQRACFAPHRDAAGFFNPWSRLALPGPAEMLRWQLGTNPFKAEKRRPPTPELAPSPLGAWGALPAAGRVMWLGHATALVEIDGLTVIIDPIFGRAGGLTPRKAPPALLPAALPRIDAVLISHGHYDHLDAPANRALAARFPEARFLVPLGMTPSLPKACRPRATELDWWQGVDLGGVTASFVPAQHWHRRGLNDENRALWGGWVIAGSRSVYHSGDTGYFVGFRAIGAAFPGLDLAILPLGAYEPRWFMGGQHMAPEDSVQALLDLGARHAMAMHWGTYDLTDEPLDHGARTLMPEIVAARGLDPGRFRVVAHGGSLGWGADGALIPG